MEQMRGEALRRVDDVRAHSSLVDAALDAGELDRRRARSLLAGGIAFRVFLWLLPAALFVAALSGLIRPSGGASPERVAKALGLAASVASTVQQATRHSDRGALLLIAIAVALMLSTSMSLVRALRVAHVLAWEEPFRRRPSIVRDGAIFSAALLAIMVLETAITYLRRQEPVLLVVTVSLSFAIVGGAWLGLSVLLPHAGARVRDLLPGALVVAGGHAALQVLTVVYLAPKLTRAPALYGSLGSAATLLLWLFLLSRLTVAAAFLNATLWRRGDASPGPGEAGRSPERRGWVETASDEPGGGDDGAGRHG
jgi:uncharacterized BrkB/YihY/UPF0761 family membrane protein